MTWAWHNILRMLYSQLLCTEENMASITAEGISAFFIPRLGITCTSTALHAEIEKAVKEIVSYQPTAEQLEVVQMFVSGRDVFVSLPTGSGKSVCFTCLPRLFDRLKASSIHHSIVLVVSPLVSLMIDQVTKLASKGIKAAYASADPHNWKSIEDGDYEVIYFSPEGLLTNATWRDMLKTPVYQDNVVCVAIDEAHLVEKWGSEFRIDFSRIGEIRSVLSSVNIMALTATAKSATRRAIIRSLNMNKCHTVSKIPNKLNLRFSVAQKPDNVKNILDPIVNELATKGDRSERYLIFCRTYADTIELFKVAVLHLHEMSALYVGEPPKRVCDKYDACTAPDIQHAIVESFTRPDGSLRLVIATVAFAMGLDAPNIREVIHWGPPDDIEMYVQETGRAGRDSLPSHATLFYHNHDVSGGTAIHCSQGMKAYCKNQTECRRQALMSIFLDSNDIDVPKPPTMHDCCDVCALKCLCSSCASTVSMDGISLESMMEHDFVLPPSIPESAMTTKAAKALTRDLQVLRDELCRNKSTDYLLIGSSIFTGLTDKVIQKIVMKRDSLCEDDLITLGVTSKLHCSEILQTVLHFNNNR